MNKKFFHTFIIFAVYLFTLRNDVMLESLGGIEGALWIPGGVALAAVYLAGWTMAIVVFFSAFFAHWFFGASAVVASGMALGASLAVWAGASVLRAASDFHPSLGRLHAVLWFMLVGLVVCPLVGTSIGLLITWLAGDFDRAQIVELIPVWWAGKAIGILTTAPLLFIFTSSPRMKISWIPAFEAIICVLIFLVSSNIIFLEMPGPVLAGTGFFRHYYLMFPLVIWVAFRFGPLGGALLVFAVSLAALLSLNVRAGYVVPAGLFEALTGMQMFVLTVAVSSLILSASISQAKTSELKFKSMFYKSGVPMAQVASSGRFVEANQKYCEMLGYSREKLLTMTFSDITYPDDRQEDRQRFEHMYEGRTDSFHSEKRYVRANGEIIWVTVDAALIPGESVAESFSLGVVKDVSVTRIAEEDAKMSRANAVAANRAKSVFLANMSHEIRTPLGVILGFVELLKDESLDASQRGRYLETIHRNAVELGRLIDDVLDLSKVEAGRLDITKESVFLPRLLEDIQQTFEVALRRKGLQFEIKSGSGVPEIIVTDQKRLRQILINVVGNAIKFTSAGSISIDLHMLPSSGDTRAPKLSIAVKDTGCGIADGERSKIFVPFGQASKTSSKNFGGTGLGLVLSRRLAGLLGGDVVLTESKESEGSTFTITIDPRTAEQVASAEAPARLPIHEKQLGKPLSGKRILVAEDTPDQAILIQLLLADQGAIVETVANGAQAIEKAPAGNFDAVLMDMQMPVMDGFAATRKLRELGFRKPILAITAQVMREDKEKCFEAGCSTHVAKPFTQKVLTDTILRVLSGDEVPS